MLETIETHLPLITAIVSFLVAMGTLAGTFLWSKFSLEKTEADVAKHEVEMEANRKDISDIKDRIGNTEVSVGFIRDNIKIIMEYMVRHKDEA